MREEIKNVDANICPYCGHKLRWNIGQILIRRWPNNTGTNQIKIEGYYKDINGRLGYVVRHLGGHNGLYEDDSKTYVTTEYALALDNYESTEKQKIPCGKRGVRTMSAIEKYLKNKFNTNSIGPDCREAVAYIKGFGEGWKEALEWALNQLEMEENSDIFVNRIQKELGQ